MDSQKRQSQSISNPKPALHTITLIATSPPFGNLSSHTPYHLEAQAFTSFVPHFVFGHIPYVTLHYIIPHYITLHYLQRRKPKTQCEFFMHAYIHPLHIHVDSQCRGPAQQPANYGFANKLNSATSCDTLCEKNGHGFLTVLLDISLPFSPSHARTHTPPIEDFPSGFLKSKYIDMHTLSSELSHTQIAQIPVKMRPTSTDMSLYPTQLT